MTGLCCVCRGPLPDTGISITCCDESRRWILWALDAVQTLWPELPEYLERGRRESGPRVSGNTRTGSPMPPAEHVLDLLGPGGVPDRLGRHLDAILTARSIRSLPTTGTADHRLDVALHGLRLHLPWAVQAYDLKPLAQELNDLVGQMQAAVGDVPERDTTTKALGRPCPVERVDTGQCGGQLRYDRTTRRVSCDGCGRDFDLSRLMAMA